MTLAKLETSVEKKTEGSRFSHFVSYGFRVGANLTFDDAGEGLLDPPAARQSPSLVIAGDALP